MVGVGLRWSQGYTSQHIGADGYPYDEWADQKPDVLSDTGVRVRVRVAAREVECRVWRVGRYAIAPLYLLEPTDPRDRWITRRLYDPRPDCRLAQEMLLGIGGVRALRALHLPVERLPLQRGPRGLRGLELIADRMEAGRAFARGVAAARRTIVFTTHTPVPAGNEVHALADLRRLGAELRAGRRASWPQIGGDPFNMTVAGLRLARLANAVAAAPRRDRARDVGARRGRRAHHRDHQRRARRRPGRTRASARRARQADERLLAVATHQALKARAARRGRARAPACASIPTRSPIGFARRAATYKRADLILARPGAPRATAARAHGVQLVFAGKAHPRRPARARRSSRRLVEAPRQWPDSVVFLENYDMAARPRCSRAAATSGSTTRARPLEASGTSGMKAAMNGMPNLSVLDGWWPEGCEHGVTGWAIGDGTERAAIRTRATCARSTTRSRARCCPPSPIARAGRG